MKCVQVVCPQCGRGDAYLQPEEGDYTAGPIPIVKWICPSCGYPDIIIERRV